MRFLSFVLGLSLPLLCFAQKHTLAIQYKPGLSYFGKQGERFTHPYFASRKGDRSFKNAASVLYTYKTSTMVGLTVGAEYAQQGQHINFKADSAFPSFTRQILNVQLTYIRVPLLINYSLVDYKKASFTIYSGISVGVAVVRKDNYQEIILEHILLPAATMRYKKIDVAIPLGMNYTQKITPLLSAIVGGEYSLGVTNAFANNTGSRFGVLNEFSHSKQNRLSLHVGIGFVLGK